MAEINKIQIPHFSPSELNPKILKLFEIIQQQGEAILKQAEHIQELRDEIAKLKGGNGKPRISPSRMEKETSVEDKKGEGDSKRAGSAKESKSEGLKIHTTKIIRPEFVPEGSKFKGFREWIVQGLKIEAHNTLYQLERWLTPSGEYVEGKLPAEVKGHFSASLSAFILYQHNQCHVTQPRLLEQLKEFGVDISAGQIDRILSEGKEGFHEEKEELLTAGLSVSDYIQVDDTGARHGGKNGYCTVIGNDYFAWFSSTGSKSRINFLELLRGRHKDYAINEEAIQYMREQKLPPFRLKQIKKKWFRDKSQWEKYLKELGVIDKHHLRILTEGALVGSLFDHGFNPNLVILSDDAGQFNVLLHSLCWIHAERTINMIVPFHDMQREDLERVREQIWNLYRDLKAYKLKPGRRKKRKLERQFDGIFTQKTCFATLNCALKRLYQNKQELLMVLSRPEIPLHNNASETDIREYVTRRKISGGTRHDRGKRARDTFTSLKKTCRKLGISFWDYLLDRIHGNNQIPYLPDLICQKAAST